ncbi:gluconate 2-dehydrogenase subunit 3 family protein [Mucilaginibacter flavus]|uniref:gluconate 2-dehydrogenase subunit 3 family protein n=1 Tax=Mucilaginibacter flavus TaxID=931504 RepID=UPI0025B52893|nr:gluconate 2-dehydrogenase subunit 3 family protein [Mucilaginibacter flavus]MDN3579259.1 gluconate 2-dehydrogenase subunit 3 family protein [Mucilaginibacter flavus]
MHRRTAIRNLALIIGGAALLPACMQEKGKPSIALKNVDLNADQEKLVGDIAETIIPKTSTPGAKDLGLHLFVLKMLDDCYKKDDQQAFITGAGQFTDAVSKKYDKLFADLSAKQREEMLLSIEADKDPKSTTFPKELKTFYGIIKGQTVNGYTNSKYFMTRQVVYELVPGRYNARFPYKQKQSA